MDSISLQSLDSMDDRMTSRVITSKPVPGMRYRGKHHQGMISIASTLIHQGRSRLPGVSLELGGELLEQEEDSTDVEDGKRGSVALGGRFEEGEEVVP